MRLEVAARAEMGRGEIAGVVKLAAPAVAHMALVAATFVGDRAILAGDPTALAALHLPSTVVWCLCSLLGSVGVAAVALVGRHHGARRADRRDAAVQASLILGRKIGIAAVVPALLVGLALIFLVAPELAAAAAGHLAIAVVALPAAGVEAAAAGSLQATGDTRTPLLAGAAGAAVHLAITACLAASGHGLEGAAVGTVAGFAVAALGCLLGLGEIGDRAPISALAALEPSELAEARAELVRLLLPTAGERVGYHAGYLGYAAAIASLGPAAMAANQALLAFEALAYPVAEGCGIAAAALVAQRLGEGDRRRARMGLVVSAWLAVGALGLFGSLAVANPELWASWLSRDPEIVALSAATLPWLALGQPAMAFAVVGAMALRGAGATRSAMAITLAGTALRLALTIILIPRYGLEGAWIASAADWLLQSLCIGWAFARRAVPARA